MKGGENMNNILKERLQQLQNKVFGGLRRQRLEALIPEENVNSGNPYTALLKILPLTVSDCDTHDGYWSFGPPGPNPYRLILLQFGNRVFLQKKAGITFKEESIPMEVSYDNYSTSFVTVDKGLYGHSERGNTILQKLGIKTSLEEIKEHPVKKVKIHPERGRRENTYQNSAMLDTKISGLRVQINNYISWTPDRDVYEIVAQFSPETLKRIAADLPNPAK